ncbi:NAD-dependent epimerase [Paraneptunicella aestuarii]|uniref:NAD-dependent epimerase n=1 Tax=Paraneptunicella aestuarii TaxID=2831148 RepID=UPI001E5E4DD2|nr:NAD-dependent epimerase [Paraneptunicella aestuarii]UAA39671.1 NAD-dependent epimerase [Paraneptunicella aestuarii]
MKVLVTGAAGFIGMHVSAFLLARGDTVVGIDNINDYYDPKLKQDRLSYLQNNFDNFSFHKMDLCETESISALFAKEQFQRVVNLAAQAGVRYSIENPRSYVDSNIVGFLNILESCKNHQIEHLVYASSSSVYGANESSPFSVQESVEHPLSMYAATKKANELMAHTYSALHQLPTTGLRFFTAYGPWGRPDMALFKFTKAILSGETMQVFNYGKHRRDFTYIDDIVKGIILTLDNPATPDPEWNGESPSSATSRYPWRVYNIGNSKPVELMDYIHEIEKKLGKQANMELLPLQPGDVPNTYSDVSELAKDTGYKPEVDVAEGISRFIDWYLEYYQ